MTPKSRGFVRRRRSRRVLVLDCRSQQWRSLPKMRQPRASPAAYVKDGLIIVIGGCRSKNIETWGEIYDLKTNTWGRILLQSHDPTVQNAYLNRFKPNLQTNACYVEIDKVSCLIFLSDGKLFWRETKQGFERCSVILGDDEQVSSYQLVSVANAAGGGRVTVWWKSGLKVLDLLSGTETWECYTNSRCAEISFERRGLRELWGFVEWSREVFTVDGYDDTYDFFLNSAIVTY
ncbi:putative kelch-type beta propeller [Arabidopsis thaliana]|uniref:FKB95-like N-terminal Kelch domain-containing protein n=2 Tax=Arabidopsis TaxID=3701 RepID=A0A178UDY3_ARATH|nr:Kelch repeat type 1 [Arabidopsis thaliana x Arabidopsis arenosa]OAO91925.1 hypothetical protein AXX17_AT5G02170 [Arabidopsis thaliana]